MIQKILCSFLFLMYSSLAEAQLTAAKIFTSHMVLQRETDIPVWGNATPGVEVTVELSNKKASVITASDGKWKLYLPKFKAGGPYQLKVYETKNPKTSSIIFNDVLIGDVWLASGQSNMEMEVQQSKNPQAEIANANYPNIRLFKVSHAVGLQPATDFKDETVWKVCDSNSIKTTSAVAYFFARKIYTDVNVPVGILQTAWGGTPVEAWTSREMLLSSSITKQKVLDNDTLTNYALIKDTVANSTFWKIVYNPQNDADKIIPQTFFDDSEWDTVTMPGLFRNVLHPTYEGIIWLRKSFTLLTNNIEKDVTINLGHPEMNYSLYINGHEICKNIWNASFSHSYIIPSNYLVKGKNNITVRMAALWGGGGFNPPGNEMYLLNGNNKINLAGNWKYKINIEPAVPQSKNYQNYPTMLYNAMVAPVVGYAIKGFLWYQGESNAWDAYNYRTLFPMMINDWRNHWGQGNLPFFYVQLANFMKQKNEPVESEWAELREAQALTLSLPNTGMACIVDIGDANDIHPKNKQEVGRRLALIAETKCYQKNIIANGPVYKNYVVRENEIVIGFEETSSQLRTLFNEKLTGFSIAGADRKFYWASARIEGKNIIVSSDKVRNPVAVRYAWADNPDCNLINSEGLPALPFRTDQWKGITQK
jgi:sialate O-acetylesterase